ncbi:MAG: xanthine dehydrogenase family protein molybdopterin-binding subunit [Acidobacteriota bacterium]
MTATRRDVLRLGLIAGASLVVPIRFDALSPATPRKKRDLKPAPDPERFRHRQWISIDASGQVTLVVHKSEMGQGVRTSLPMILAEELEADWRSVVVVQAEPGPDFPDMGTSGSDAVESSWLPLRQAGASARALLIEAAARTWKVPAFDCRAEAGTVRHDASGRVAPYGDLVGAAARLPIPTDAPLKSAAEFRLIGSRVRRLDGPAIVSGAAVYGLDVRVPGMLRAAIARCPVPGGHALSFDASAAKRISGVREVASVPSGVAVVADDTWSAFAGRDALAVVWDEGENASHDSAIYWARLEKALDQDARTTRSEGDAKAALGAAGVRRIDAEYRFPFQAHATVETMNATASLAPGKAEIWAGTQSPNGLQARVAKLLSIPPAAVRVHVPLLGGGFGRRIANDYAIEAVEVARVVGRPVQVVWSRQDDMRHDFYQPASITRFSGGLDARGRVAAWWHRSSTFHLTLFGPLDVNDPDTWGENPWGGFDNPYGIPALRVEYAVQPSPVPTGAWRAVDYPPTVFARESFVDELARASGRDPLGLRRELLGGPNPTIGKRVIDLGRIRRVLDLAADKAGWGTPLPAASGERRGRGIACNVYHGRTVAAQVAEVTVRRDGHVSVDRIVCAFDCGRIINRAGLEGQIESGIVWGLAAALFTRITFRKGRVEQGNYRDFPVPRLPDCPKIEIHLVEGADRPSGAGEQPVPPTAPAIANAIFAATGRRVRTLPIRPEDLIA